MSREIELLIEIRDLLQVMAEPALAKRDAKLRSSLRTAVGSSGKKAKAALLMDGSRSLRAPRHRDHLFHGIVITHSTTS
jgi:hypothetical protein